MFIFGLSIIVAFVKLYFSLRSSDRDYKVRRLAYNDQGVSYALVECFKSFPK